VNINNKQAVNVNIDKPPRNVNASIDDATPAEWDALHKQMSIEGESGDVTGLSASQQAQLGSICFECG
jgi:hypothetical protein